MWTALWTWLFASGSPELRAGHVVQTDTIVETAWVMQQGDFSYLVTANFSEQSFSDSGRLALLQSERHRLPAPAWSVTKFVDGFVAGSDLGVVDGHELYSSSRRSDNLLEWTSRYPESVRHSLKSDAHSVSRVLHVSTFRDMLLLGTKTHGDWPDGSLYLLDLDPNEQPVTVGGFGSKAVHGLRHVAQLRDGLVALASTPPRGELCWVHAKPECDHDYLRVMDLGEFADHHLLHGRTGDRPLVKTFRLAEAFVCRVAALAGFETHADVVVACAHEVRWVRFEGGTLKLVAVKSFDFDVELLSMASMDYPRVVVGATHGQFFVVELSTRLGSLDAVVESLEVRNFTQRECEPPCDVVSVLRTEDYLATATRDGSVNFWRSWEFDWSFPEETTVLPFATWNVAQAALTCE